MYGQENGELSEREALALIEECTTNEGDKPDDWDPIETHITLRNSFQSESLDRYPINPKSVEILYSKGESSDAKEWDGDFSALVIFRFPGGFGVATDVGWWSPTFTGHKYTLDVTETDDYVLFDKLCLTDEIRLQAAPALILKGILE